MVAQSVTGTGQGSAEGKTKGADRQTLGSEKILGPQVVIAGQVTLPSGSPHTIKFPKLEGTPEDYSAVAATEDGSSIAVKLDMDATSTSVTLTGTASTLVYYMVSRNGMAM